MLLTVEILLLLVTLFLFGGDLWTLLMGVIDLFNNSSYLTTQLQVQNALTHVGAGLLIMILALLLIELFIVHRGAYPLRNTDEIAAHIPRDMSYSLENQENTAQTTFDSAVNFGLPYDPRYGWERVFPNMPQPEIANDPKYGRTLNANIGMHISDFLKAYVHQLAWFAHIRGVNSVIRNGREITQESGREYSRMFGFIIGDVDSAYVLDAVQNEQGNGRPPTVGWYGINTTSRRTILGTATLWRTSKQENNVIAYTSDGIPITADITGVFRLGQRPQCVNVAFSGIPRNADSLRSIRVDRNRETNRVTISDSNAQLKYADLQFITGQSEQLINDYQNQPLQDAPGGFDFEFNPERVIRAITSQPINRRGDPQPWEEILVQYCKDVYGRTILNYSFNDLFGDVNTISGNRYPIDDVLDRMTDEVTNDGLLYYRLYWHRDFNGTLPSTSDAGIPFYNQDKLGNAPTAPQQSAADYRRNLPAIELPANTQAITRDGHPNYLRLNGIRVISAEFRNVRPLLPDIDDTRIYDWESSMQQDIDIARGEIDEAHNRIMGEAQADIQQQIGQYLLTILNSGASREVALLQLMNALDSIADRPDLKNIIPRDLQSIINSLREWLTPQDSEGNN